MDESIARLPECLILECLARLHLKEIHVASRVCHKWLRLIRSRYFYTLRKQLGYTNQVACLLQNFPPPKNYNLKYVINMFDPINREWNRLPVPNFTNGLPWSTSIASSEGKLVVFTDCDPKSRDPVKSVFVLDFVTWRWRKGNGMPLIRSPKFCTVTSQCHRIFISGDIGREEDAVWEYDVGKEEWTEFHRVRSGQIRQLQVIGEELWVIIGCRGITNISMFKHGVDVYHLQTKKWRQVKLDLEGLDDLFDPQIDLKLYELMKKFSENKLWVMENCSQLQLGKQSLLMSPTATLNSGCYGQEELFVMQDQDGNFERMQPNSVFSGYVESSCCVEF
ncbi:F-box/kelch-repeat protein At2g44130-like [Impatiens glandulifera]|uniref:F-box/kelch-repeat protein At2g44130-like n=1 Tax=Impatiens glandulifera TaxID=253017 RepID=UPI001FB051A3|nr:F-box/kelch-repeat protein At2g44130-like [Impatiens glandulifera]XP_047341435.1 F-box/kelch-repeat protein At2g44130-like [Impatiens glandulifera]